MTGNNNDLWIEQLKTGVEQPTSVDSYVYYHLEKVDTDQLYKCTAVTSPSPEASTLYKTYSALSVMFAEITPDVDVPAGAFLGRSASGDQNFMIAADDGHFYDVMYKENSYIAFQVKDEESIQRFEQYIKKGILLSPVRPQPVTEAALRRSGAQEGNGLGWTCTMVNLRLLYSPKPKGR